MRRPRAAPPPPPPPPRPRARGRSKASPINHGPCSPDRLLEEAARVVKTNFIERANSIQFNVIALAAADGDS